MAVLPVFPAVLFTVPELLPVEPELLLTEPELLPVVPEVFPEAVWDVVLPYEPVPEEPVSEGAEVLLPPPRPRQS